MSDRDLPLGKATDYDADYDPRLLYPIARRQGRARLGLAEAPLPFKGADIWNAYELSWLDPAGKPEVAWGEFRFDAATPAIVESKSFKLYLNSFNQHRCADIDAVAEMLRRDLAACVGAAVEVALFSPQQWGGLVPQQPSGLCLDDLPVTIHRYQPAPELLRCVSEKTVSQQLFSRLLRSRCPVTGQPDWGTVHIHYTGRAIDTAGLLAYIVSFRQHQDFHEQCVERMFMDLSARCAPTALTVYARYLRRGGLDINPYRSSGSERPANGRGALQ